MIQKIFEWLRKTFIGPLSEEVDARIGSTFGGSLAISFAIINWRVFAVLLFAEHKGRGFITYIEEYDWCRLYIWPLLLAIFYVLGVRRLLEHVNATVALAHHNYRAEAEARTKSKKRRLVYQSEWEHAEKEGEAWRTRMGELQTEITRLVQTVTKHRHGPPGSMNDRETKEALAGLREFASQLGTLRDRGPLAE